MKAILATGELATLNNVARASVIAMQAGADFIKTSTGKEGVNATLPRGPAFPFGRSGASSAAKWMFE